MRATSFDLESRGLARQRRRALAADPEGFDAFAPRRRGGPAWGERRKGPTRAVQLAALLGLAVCAGCDSRHDGPLPLRRLILYSTGLGYFEREGRLSDGELTEIPLAPGQLDDALKSLVILSEGAGASVEYEPPLAPEAARTLAGLPASGEGRDFASLLSSLKGASVRVETKGAQHEGRVVEVAPSPEGAPAREAVLILFGASGLRQLPLSSIASVTPLEPGTARAWEQAAAAEEVQPHGTRLKVRAHGRGTLALGYTTEAPVWRTTYRLVFAEGHARLQGFALVHNDSDEAWSDVQVTLVSGKPASFVYPLAEPRYGRRELVAPDEALSTAPQLATAEAREHLRGFSGESESIGVGFGTLGAGRGSGAYGSGSGVLSGQSGRVTTVSSGGLLAHGPSPLAPAAVSEVGDLFLYTVAAPVKLQPRRSGLLPILDGEVQAERVTVLQPGTKSESGVRLKNSTASTLEAGTLAFFADGAFTGEAQIDRIKPGEVRVLTHGEDLDVESAVQRTPSAGPVQAVRRVGDQLQLHYVARLAHRVVATSRSARARTVLVALEGEGYRVVAGATEEIRSPGQPRYASLPLPPHGKLEVDVVEEAARAELVPVTELTLQRVESLLAQEPPAEARAPLSRLRAELGRTAQLVADTSAVNEQLRQLEADAHRIQESVAAAGKGGARTVAEELGRKLVALEAALDPLRTRRAQLEGETARSRKALLEAIAGR